MDSLVDGNHTAVTGFILLGLTDDPKLRVIVFTVILCIYLVTILGNLSTIILIRISSQLHHPMYLFLSHMAFADIGYSSCHSQYACNIMVERNTIYYYGCAIQLVSATFSGTSEGFLLATMAYDRFVAICNPLLYSVKMTTQIYVQLLSVAYIAGFLNASSFTLSFFFYSSVDQIELTTFTVILHLSYHLTPTRMGTIKKKSTRKLQVLERMWRHTYSLLVGMLNDANTLQGIVAVPQEVKYRIAI